MLFPGKALPTPTMPYLPVVHGYVLDSEFWYIWTIKRVRMLWECKECNGAMNTMVIVNRFQTTLKTYTIKKFSSLVLKTGITQGYWILDLLSKHHLCLRTCLVRKGKKSEEKVLCMTHNSMYFCLEFTLYCESKSNWSIFGIFAF